MGARLKLAREAVGLSLQELAVILGYTQPGKLSLMETGKREPTLKVLLGYTNHCSTTLDFLCGLSDDVERDPAIAVKRQVLGMVACQMDQVVQRLENFRSEAACQLIPAHGDGARLAAVAMELARAVDRARSLNRDFDELRGGATLVSKAALAHDLGARYAEAVDRARRLMLVRIAANDEHAATCDELEPDQARSFRPLTAYQRSQAIHRRVASRLRSARETAEVQVDVVAELAGVEPTDLVSVEAGDAEPSLRVVVAYAEICGASLDHLVGLVDDIDRDPAIAMGSHVAHRINADMRAIAGSLADHAVAAARSAPAGAAAADRMAAAATELQAALDDMRRRQPWLDNRVRGGSRLLLLVGALEAARAEYQAATARRDRVAGLMEAIEQTSRQVHGNFAHGCQTESIASSQGFPVGSPA